MCYFDCVGLPHVIVKTAVTVPESIFSQKKLMCCSETIINTFSCDNYMRMYSYANQANQTLRRANSSPWQIGMGRGSATLNESLQQIREKATVVKNWVTSLSVSLFLPPSVGGAFLQWTPRAAGCGVAFRGAQRQAWLWTCLAVPSSRSAMSPSRTAWTAMAPRASESFSTAHGAIAKVESYMPPYSLNVRAECSSVPILSEHHYLLPSLSHNIGLSKQVPRHCGESQAIQVIQKKRTLCTPTGLLDLIFILVNGFVQRVLCFHFLAQCI